MTIEAANTASIILFSNRKAAGIVKRNDAANNLSIIHKRTWSPCVLIERE